MLIYEVNIEISKNIYPSYIKWLDSHIIEMLKIKGFINSKKFLNKNLCNDQYMYISVHYYLESIELLEKYLNNKAKKMRTILDKRFINNIKINRRVIHEI